MKIMNKFQKKLANRKKDNKGFSLVELIIALPAAAVNSQNTQISGFLSIGFLLKLPIDKLRGLCYN